MPRIRRSDRFIRSLNKLLSQKKVSKKQVEKFLKLLTENPSHPSLRVKKIQGSRDIFETSLTMNIRVTFVYLKSNTVYLRNVGEHDITLKKH